MQLERYLDGQSRKSRRKRVVFDRVISRYFETLDRDEFRWKESAKKLVDNGVSMVK